MNISYEVFDSKSPKITGQASIVLVSLDSTVRSYWHQAVASLRSDITLNRYVIDEVHLILTEASYRDVMHHIKELRNHSVQMVLLSATIAPTSIASIREQANLAQGLETLIIRASSNRPELYFQPPQAYSDFTTALPSIIKFIQNKLKAFTKRPLCRALVFVQRIDHGHRVAGALSCDFYRGSTDKELNDQEREAMVNRWLNGQHNIMVATDAFGPGNDYPHVQQVFFVASPRGIVDFLQMAGRAGRNGQVASIYTFLLADTTPFFSHTAIAAHLGASELAPLLKKPLFRCWRSVFCQFLDGVAQPC
ncbi:P-loop containing nucleoside triphosphate hydrolase protein, partial [Ganoderma leucocontextum]